MPDLSGLPPIFLAYPSEEPHRDSMGLLAGELRGFGVEVQTWEVPSEPGSLWSGPGNIREAIDRSGLLLAESTFGNGNVHFELGYAIGYAIGSGKHGFSLVDSKVEDLARSDLKLIETQAKIIYGARGDIHSYLEGLMLDGPSLIEQLGAPSIPEHPNGLFFLPAQFHADLNSALLATAKDSTFNVASVDTQEPQFFNLKRTVESVARARVFVGVMVRDGVRQHRRTNAHAMFVAGLAHGLGKRFVLVAEQPSKRLLDLDENLLEVVNETGAKTRLRSWLADVGREEFAQAARTAEAAPPSPAEAPGFDSVEDLETLSLGPLDARSDLDLEAYFVKTPQFLQARRQQERLFVGAKGSGKSANYDMLYEELVSHHNEVLVAINPSEFEFTQLATVFDEHIAETRWDFVYSSFWRILLVTEIAKQIADRFHPRSAASAESG